MAIVNSRLPPEVEAGAIGGPLYKTTVLVAASGDEQRIAEWDIGRGEWDVGYGISTKTLLLKVIAHFRAVQAKFRSWRFKDWSDFEASNENFGTGDGTTTIFQLTKSYSALNDAGSPVLTVTRSIKSPLSTGLVIKVNGTPTALYTLLAGGIIQFNSAPANGAALTWVGEFDVIARYDVDKLNVSMREVEDIGSVRGIRILEVLDTP